MHLPRPDRLLTVVHLELLEVHKTDLQLVLLEVLKPGCSHADRIAQKCIVTVYLSKSLPAKGPRETACQPNLLRTRTSKAPSAAFEDIVSSNAEQVSPNVKQGGRIRSRLCLMVRHLLPLAGELIFKSTARGVWGFGVRCLAVALLGPERGSVWVLGTRERCPRLRADITPRRMSSHRTWPARGGGSGYQPLIRFLLSGTPVIHQPKPQVIV